MSAAPVILFGLGAAKAGTTWLYRYLAGHPDCAMPAVKELHWFDTVETGRWEREETRIARERDRRLARMPAETRWKTRKLAAEVAGYNDWLGVLQSRDESRYRDFLMRTGDGAALVGDITPAYGTVGEASLARMAAIAGARFVFLMREPVARLWSNVRMVADRSVAARGGDRVREAARLLDKTLAGGQEAIARRSDYAGTLERTARAVPSGHLFTAFFEELFQPGTIAQLCAFLGIAAAPADTDRRVLAGTDMAMTAQQRDRARAWLAPQYHAVNDRMGRLPAAWTAQMEAL